MAKLLRDDATWAALAEALTPFFHADFEAVGIDGVRGRTIYQGLDGFRAGWLDWLSPWATYRTEIEDAIDLGERVLLLVRDFGRRERSNEDVAISSAAVWTLRDGRIALAEFHTDRSQALKAVGLI